MSVLVHGQRERRRVARRRRIAGVAVRALHHVPAVVAAAGIGDRLEVHLFDRVLPDVGDPEVARRAVEAPAERVPETERPDLVARRRSHERVVGRNPIDPPSDGDRAGREERPHIDAQHLAEQALWILRGAGAAAVAGGEPQEPVGPECDGAAPMISVRVGLIDEQQRLLAVRVGHVGVGRRPEAGHDGVGVRVGEVDGEQARAGVVGREGKAEQPAFAGLSDAAPDVEERCGEHDAVLHDPDAACALDHEHARVAVRRRRVDRLTEAAPDQNGPGLALRSHRLGRAHHAHHCCYNGSEERPALHGSTGFEDGGGRLPRTIANCTAKNPRK